MKSGRRLIRFASEDDAITDVRRLRQQGYTQVGTWSLPQMAWHLNRAVLPRMKPGPDAPEQIARKPLAQHVLSMNGYLPDGIVAPPEMAPPADAPEASIDELIASLEQLRDFKGEIAPHRLFGKLPDADARRLNLIHCAHHLSYLAPRQ